MDLQQARKTLSENKTNENVIWIGNMGFEASPEHIICRVDDFRSGHECPKCLGKDVRNFGGDTYNPRLVSVVDCDNCSGKGAYPKNGNQVKCSQCDGTGKMACPACGGKGGSIIQPENTEGRPTTGVVVSAGARAELYHLGDKVMFTSYSGHELTLKGKDLETEKEVEVTIRILVERDILAKVYGNMERKNFKKSMALHTNA